MKRSFSFLAILFATTTAAQAEPLLPTFDPANFDPAAAIDNPYLSLAPGFSREVRWGGCRPPQTASQCAMMMV